MIGRKEEITMRRRPLTVLLLMFVSLLLAPIAAALNYPPMGVSAGLTDAQLGPREPGKPMMPARRGPLAG
jgi:hypothetical protein